MMSQNRFEDTQYMINPPAVRYGFGLLMIALIILMTVIYLEQWGTEPLPLPALVLVCALFVILFCLFVFLRFRITVDDSAIRIKSIPTRVIPFSEIESVEIREYKALKEYGGWGIRYGIKKVGYVSPGGNSGVEFTLKDGKKILIGTERTENLYKAVKN